MFTIVNEYGFKLWNSVTPYNMSQITLNDGFLSPYYPVYGASPTYSDVSLVQEFVTQCRAANIEPLPYINSVHDFNVLHGFYSNGQMPASRQNQWVN